MNFIDLHAQQQQIRGGIEAAIKKVLDHGKYIMGPEVRQLEEALAEFVGVKHCISVANGTDALLVAMMALDIGPGDEVITPAFSYLAAAEMIVFLGATPILIDVDERTFNLDSLKLEAAINRKTKAIIPVNLFGQCCDFDAINAVAVKYNIPVIEDAAQSMGAAYKGRKSCQLGTIATTSFFPAKPLGCYGDGGACFTNDDELARRMSQIRVHGQAGKYNHVCIGMNSRLDSLQAAILLEKLKIFPKEIQLRQAVADRYKREFGDMVELPFVEDCCESVYAQYVVKVNNRNKVVAFLKERSVPSVVHYPKSIHDQPAYEGCVTCADDLLFSKYLSEVVLSLPMHPYLQPDKQDIVVRALLDAVSE